MGKLDAYYVLTEPSKQNVLDMFDGEWSCRLPDHLGLVTKPGVVRAFEDDRVIWAEKTIGSFAGFKILELGPLEGGHSYMFQDLGAEKVISIEANTRAFLKCLCIKDMLNLERVDFRLGDFMPFLEKETEQYDLLFASGVLYHMEEPLKLLNLISKVADKVFVWTHYYNREVIMARRDLKRRFSSIKSLKYNGVSYEYSNQSYNNALASIPGFCGGSQAGSKWLTRDSIIKALQQFGFKDLQINFEQVDHPNGPAFAICAQK